MANLILDDILKATGGEILTRGPAIFHGVSIDSRTIREGELFVALKGERFDGHDYLSGALGKGYGALISASLKVEAEGRTIIRVKDTLGALQDIARHLRKKFTGPVIAVTGTNGKTTTKELIASIFGVGHKVLKTTGNLNNHIGVPLCMSVMDRDEDMMVIEMGSNAAGDIRLLCDIALPDYAVATNVGQAHIEGFGDIKTVRDTDLEVLGYAKTFAVNADDTFLVSGVGPYQGRTITYGIDNPADVYARDIELTERGSTFRLCMGRGRETMVELMLPGRFNISNALAASAIADAAGASMEEIRQGLGSFTGVPMRLEIREIEGMTIILDAYNANPSSMEEAVKELQRLKRGRTIAVLGDMLELGAYADDAHSGTVIRLNDLGVDMLIAAGSLMKKASSLFNGDCYCADDSMQAGAILSGICRQGDTILIKGSRGMRMEKVLAGLDLSTSGRAENAA